jgi:hypothetical protein
VKDGGYLVLSDVFGKGGHGPAGPADGPLRQQELIDSLSGRGFTLLRWEAHDRLLREFMVRMIFAGESLPDSWGCGQRRSGEKTDRSGISYFLLVARKSGATFSNG